MQRTDLSLPCDETGVQFEAYHVLSETHASGIASRTRGFSWESVQCCLPVNSFEAGEHSRGLLPFVVRQELLQSCPRFLP